ncbi:TPA: hypothetical protein DCX15_03180 [bacterium]|nr:hypothetical protein [bacterium]
MALRQCRECRKEVSAEAISCPHCGCPFPTGKKEDLKKFLSGWEKYIPPEIREELKKLPWDNTFFPSEEKGERGEGKKFLYRHFPFFRGFEWKSKTTLFGLPLIHIAIGWTIGLEEGRWRLRPKVAKGIIAIGQFAFGVITIAQIGIGLLFGFGQVILGLTVVAQFALGVIFGLGQFATGYVAIGQFVLLAYYGLACMGNAVYLWSVDRKNIEAVEFFHQLLREIMAFFGK